MSTFIPIEFQKAFDKTKQKAIRVTADYRDNLPLLSSHFGGVGYWESGTDFPVDKQNRPLALLAQINFSEVPAHKDLPNSGILQFFIPRHDEYYGADLETLGTAGQLVVQFWEQPDENRAVSMVDDVVEDDLVPIFGGHQLSFSSVDEVAGIDTIECAEALNANPFEVLEDVALNEKEENIFYEAITAFTQSHGHKLLGYPYWINEEPRENSDYRLFLQIDTDMDGDNDIMWGDNGVGQLWIKPEDLSAQRFDKVWFYWDCN